MSRVHTLGSLNANAGYEQPNQQTNQQQTEAIDRLLNGFQMLNTEANRVREENHKLKKIIQALDARIKKLESNEATTQRSIQEIRYKADVSYTNSTAEDNIHDYMVENREMIENDSPMTGHAFHQAVEDYHSKRRGRQTKS